MVVQEKTSDRERALEEALRQIRKAYGEGAIMRLGEMRPVGAEVIPTGILSLDLALGVGGVPRGRII
ncbi:MAG: DNA recombination/repair protein RecA, partial [Chloroflexota bacterium]|nr:DNA recombination/repair protein RecA [Chloroflexota bacterium]